MKINEHKMPIKVCVRIKLQDDVFNFDHNTITTYNSKNTPIEYSFDRVFSSENTTRDIYKLINPFDKNFEKSNISILAYGQTGSGKTFTMYGTQTQPGIVTLLLKDLLKSTSVSLSFIEIYNEKIFDLFDNKEKHLREAAGEVFIQDQIFKKISVLSEFQDLRNSILKLRKTAKTNLNQNSSRSHLILQLKLQDRIINLVDLAGSENNKKTGNEGIRMEESANINRSLFVLNKVVNSIVNKEIRIPYRDSKLTRLLQNSIGGSSRCFIIATVINGSDNSGEIINTLNFAAKSRKIVNQAFKTSSQQNSVRSLPHQNLFENLYLNNKIASDHPAQQNKFNENASVKKLENENTKRIRKPLADKTNQNSSSIIKSSFLNKSSSEMSPVTKQKSLNYFITKAIEYENLKEYKLALDAYKTIRKFADSAEISSKIKYIQGLIKKEKSKLTKFEALQILNSGIFLEVKKLSGVGDKRAQAIVDFIAGGHIFETLEDLKMIFSEKIFNGILEGIE